MNHFTFLAAATVLAITPGPGLTYVVARTVSGGRAQGMASCLGTAMGGLFHVLAAALGLSLVIAQSAVAFNAVKLIGVVFLLYLGLRMLMRRPDMSAVTVPASQGWTRTLIDGVVVEVMNVKTALFFLAFLPQFVTSTTAPGPQLVLLGTICVLLNTLVDIAAVLAANRWLTGPSNQVQRARWINPTCGAVLIGLAGLLALTRRQN